jgi:hypothetical protein
MPWITVTYFDNGVLKTELIESDELLWYCRNKQVMKVIDRG